MSATWAILVIVLWVAVLGLVVLLLGALQRITRLEARGASAPAINLAADLPAVGEPLGARHAYRHLFPDGGADSVLLFVSAACQPCVKLMGRLNDARATQDMQPHTGGADIIAVTDEAGVEKYRTTTNVTRVVGQSANEIADELGVSMTPFGLAIDREGVVRGTSLLARIRR